MQSGGKEGREGWGKKRRKKDSDKFSPVTPTGAKKKKSKAQDTKKGEENGVGEKSPKCKIYIYKPGRYICIRIQGKEGEGEGNIYI
jgi:hypothetical protein